MGLPLGPPLHLSWEYKILEGGLVLPAFEGAGVGDPAVWRTIFILVAYFMCDV